MIEDAFGVMVDIPVWSLVAFVLAGTIIGMSFLLLAILTLGKVRVPASGRIPAPVAAVASNQKPVVFDTRDETQDDDIVASAQELVAELVVDKTRPTRSVPVADKVSGAVVEPAPIPTKPVYKHVPPVRQHYWYYVSGVSGRFATLREALSASGVKVSADKVLDWKKLSSDVRSKIKRVKVGDKQPVEDEPIASKVVVPEPEMPQEGVRPRVSRRGVPEPSPDTIVKPLGGGSFVTFKRKK